MQNNTSYRSQLYKNLIGSGKVSANELGNEDSFINNLSSPDIAKQLYGKLSTVFSKEEIGDENQFVSSITPDFQGQPLAVNPFINPPKMDEVASMIDEGGKFVRPKPADIDRKLSELNTNPILKRYEDLQNKRAEKENIMRYSGGDALVSPIEVFRAIKRSSVSADDEKFLNENKSHAEKLINDRKALLLQKEFIQLADNLNKYDDNKPAVEKFWTGLTKTGTMKDFASLGLTAMARNLNLLSVLKKAENNEPVTEEEQKMLQTYSFLKDVERNQDPSFAYKAGKTFQEMIPFVANMILSGGALGGVRTGISSALKVGTWEAAKQSVKGATTYGLKKLAEGAIFNAVRSPLTTTVAKSLSENVVDRYQTDENGKVIFDPNAPSDLKMLYDTYMQNYLEYFTEELGGAFTGDVAKTFVAPIFRNSPKIKALFGSSINALNKLGGNKYAKAVKEVTDLAQIQGLVGENMEEVANAGLSTVLTGSQDWKQFTDNPSELIGLTSINTLLLGGAFAAARYGAAGPSTVIENTKNKKQFFKATNELSAEIDRLNSMIPELNAQTEAINANEASRITEKAKQIAELAGKGQFSGPDNYTENSPVMLNLTEFNSMTEDPVYDGVRAALSKVISTAAIKSGNYIGLAEMAKREIGDFENKTAKNSVIIATDNDGNSFYVIDQLEQPDGKDPILIVRPTSGGDAITVTSADFTGEKGGVAMFSTEEFIDQYLQAREGLVQQTGQAINNQIDSSPVEPQPISQVNVGENYFLAGNPVSVIDITEDAVFVKDQDGNIHDVQVDDLEAAPPVTNQVPAEGATISEEQPMQQEQLPENTQQQEQEQQVDEIPLTQDGQPDYDAMEPEMLTKYLKNELSPEDSIVILGDVVKSLEQSRKNISKRSTKGVNEAIAKRKQLKEIDDKIEKYNIAISNLSSPEAFDDQGEVLTEEDIFKRDFNNLLMRIRTHNMQTPGKKKSSNIAPFLIKANRLGLTIRPDMYNNLEIIDKDGNVLNRLFSSKKDRTDVDSHKTLSEYDDDMQTFVKVMIADPEHIVFIVKLDRNTIAQGVRDILSETRSVASNSLLDALDEIFKSGEVEVKSPFGNPETVSLYQYLNDVLSVDQLTDEQINEDMPDDILEDMPDFSINSNNISENDNNAEQAQPIQTTLNNEEAAINEQQPGAAEQSPEQGGDSNPVAETQASTELSQLEAIQAEIAAEEAKVNTNPTEAQKEAGNYQKGHITIQGFDVTIENPKGSIRSGIDTDGEKWEQKMNNSYGYILGTTGRDSDHIDVFLGENPLSEKVYVVDQVNQDGSFDEHKVMIGFDDIEQAKAAYLSNYKDGWQGLGNITETTVSAFNDWAKADGKRIKPFAEYKAISAWNFISKPPKKTDEEKIKDSRLDELSPDENGDLIENGEYVFRKRQSYQQHGETINTSETLVKGVPIIEREIIPFMALQKIIVHYDVDLVLPENTIVKNGKMTNWYEADGYAHPQFEKFDDAVMFVEEWRKENPVINTNKNQLQPDTDNDILYRSNELPEKITIDGVERSTKNNLGEQIAPTEEGIRNFWKWFGDLEKTLRIEKLRNSKSVVIHSNEHKGKYDLTAESAQKWIKDNLRSKYIIKDTGESISITRVGAEEVTSHNRFDETHLKSIASIPELLSNAIFIEEQPSNKTNSKYDSYRYYVVGVKIDGVDYTVKVVIGVKQGKKYYDHRLTEMEKTKLIDIINQPASDFTSAGNASLPPYITAKDTKLISILQINSSKIIDDNGRPLLVYHGTPNKSGFTVFDKNQIGTSNDNGIWGVGFYFSPLKKQADQYRNNNGDLYTAYLSVKNPFKISDYNSIKEIADYLGMEEANFTNESTGIRPIYSQINQFTSHVIEKGHDGVISEKTNEIVVFEPNQIKSATDNNGEFNPNNEDIRYRLIPIGSSGLGIEFTRKNHTSIYNSFIKYLVGNNIKYESDRAKTGSIYLNFESNGTNYNIRFANHTKAQPILRDGQIEYEKESKFTINDNGEIEEVNIDISTTNFTSKELRDIVELIDKYNNSSTPKSLVNNYAQKISKQHLNNEDKNNLEPFVKYFDDTISSFDDFINKDFNSYAKQNKINEENKKKEANTYIVNALKQRLIEDSILEYNSKTNTLDYTASNGKVIKNALQNQIIGKKTNNAMRFAKNEFAEIVDMALNNIPEYDKSFSIQFRSSLHEQSDNTVNSTPQSLRQEAEAIASNLNIPITFIENTEAIPASQVRMRKAKGWFNPKTGEIAVVLPNNKSVADVQATILHEAVAHKGLRGLLGSRFRPMMQAVFDSMSENSQVTYLAQYKDPVTAAEEYCANIAERDIEPTTWEKIKSIIKDAFRAIGVDLRMTDADIAFMLWRSKNRLKAEKTATVKERMEDIAAADKMKEQLKFRERPETNDITLSWSEQKIETWQDKMVSVRKLIDEIEKRGGKVAISANPYIQENLSSSRAKAEVDKFIIQLWKPLLNHITDIEKNYKVKYKSITKYLMAKHAPERNRSICVNEVVMDVKSKVRSNDVTSLLEKYPNLIRFETMRKYDSIVHGVEPDLQTYENTTEGELKELSRIRKSIDKLITEITESKVGTNRSGISNEDAAVIVKEFESTVPIVDINQLWALIKRSTNFTVDTWKKYGLISNEQYKAMTEFSMFKHYVPLRGWEEKEDIDYSEFARDYMGSSILNLNKKSEGRTSLADDPLAYIASMAESAIISGNKNEIRRAAWRMVAANKEMDYLFILRNTWYVNVSETEDSKWVEVFEKPAQQLFDEGRVRTNIDTSYDWHKTSQELGVHSVPVFIDGQRMIIEFKGEIGAKAAMAINRLNSASIGKFFSAATNMNRWIAANLTSKNPDFMLTNFTRDYFFGNISYFVKGGSIANLNKNTAIAFKAIHNDRFGKNQDNEVQKMYDDFKMNGGQTGYIHLNGVEQYKKDIERLRLHASGVYPLGDRVLRNKLMTAGANALEYMALMSENAMRFAVYKTEIERMMKEANVSEPTQNMKTLAAKAAKDITVNFNRRGAQDNTLSGFFGSMFAFFNAAIQGTATFFKLAKENPSRFSIAISSLIGMSFLGSLFSALLSGGDDDDKEYDRLSDYAKFNNIILLNPLSSGKDEFFTIPTPHGFRAFASIGPLAVDVIRGKRSEVDALWELSKNIATEISPLSLSGFDLSRPNSSAGILSFITPTMLRPVIEAYPINQDYMGNEISKKPFLSSQEGIIPQWQLAPKSTNKILVGTSKMINNLAGGTDNISSSVPRKVGRSEPYRYGLFTDFNPAKIEHIFEGYLGGRLRFWNDMYKTANSILEKEVPDKQNIPVFRRLYQGAKQKSGWPEFYETRDYVEQINARMKDYKDRGDIEGQISINNYYNAQIIAIFKSYEKPILEISKNLNDVNYKAYKKQLEDQRDFLLKDFEQKIHELNKTQK